jgi:hypothetical protein
MLFGRTAISRKPEEMSKNEIVELKFLTALSKYSKVRLCELVCDNFIQRRGKVRST